MICFIFISSKMVNTRKINHTEKHFLEIRKVLVLIQQPIFYHKYCKVLRKTSRRLNLKRHNHILNFRRGPEAEKAIKVTNLLGLYDSVCFRNTVDCVRNIVIFSK